MARDFFSARKNPFLMETRLKFIAQGSHRLLKTSGLEKKNGAERRGAFEV